MPESLVHDFGDYPKLGDWCAEHYGEDQHSQMIYSNAAQSQIARVHDLNVRLNGYPAPSVNVVSSHTSKSVPLPVYRLWVQKEGFPGNVAAQIRMRGNFYDWKVSISAHRPLDLVDDYLFNPEPDNMYLNPVYFEGFEDNWVFPSYDEDNQKFSLMLNTEADLAVLFWQIRQQVAKWEL